MATTSKRTNLETFAEMVVYIKSDPSQIPKSKPRAFGHMRRRFKGATDSAIARSFEHCGVRFRGRPSGKEHFQRLLDLVVSLAAKIEEETGMDEGTLLDEAEVQALRRTNK